MGKLSTVSIESLQEGWNGLLCSNSSIFDPRRRNIFFRFRSSFSFCFLKKKIGGSDLEPCRRKKRSSIGGPPYTFKTNKLPSCPSDWGRTLFQASLPWLMSWWRSRRASSIGAFYHTGASSQCSRPIPRPVILDVLALFSWHCLDRAGEIPALGR